MRVIPPFEDVTAISASMLTSSSIAEPYSGESAYNPATTYALDAVVIDTTKHRKYRSLQGSNTGNALPAAPTLDNPNPATAWWQDIGPTNRWAMFDMLRDTLTTSASPITVVITPGSRVNSIALVGLVADSVTVTVTVGASTVYTHTKDLNTREVFDWYDYFFEPFSTQPSMVLWDLPPYTNAVITVTISRASGDVSCGACVVGSYEYVGAVQYDAQDDTVNFSKIERNFDGGSILLPRRNVPKTTQVLLVDKARVNRIRALRSGLNARPAVWSGLDDDSDGYFEALFLVGYYRRFMISLDHPTKARITLELEEI
jgi:hypothetical protein